MIDTIKAKIRRFILRLSGTYGHLKVVKNVQKKWYGNSYGGFYACPEFLNEDSVVYSFGIGEDITFDEAIVKHHNCYVFGFDPTPKSIHWIANHKRNIMNKFKFYEFGISDKTGEYDFFLPKKAEHVSGSFINQINVDEQQSIRVNLKSLVDIAAELGHMKIDVLKMDIEGAEYKVLYGILESGIHINQILVEFHDRFFPDGRDQTINMINTLKDHGFEIFGISDSLEEVSFINNKIV